MPVHSLPRKKPKKEGESLRATPKTRQGTRKKRGFVEKIWSARCADHALRAPRVGKKEKKTSLMQNRNLVSRKRFLVLNFFWVRTREVAARTVLCGGLLVRSCGLVEVMSIKIVTVVKTFDLT